MMKKRSFSHLNFLKRKRIILKQNFNLLFISFSILILSSQNLVAQTKVDSPDWDICIYKPDPNPVKGFVPMSPVLQEKMNNRSIAAACSTFNVTYTGFTAEAQTAFQYAVDIWANSIDSPVTIKIDATFAPLAPGVLGSAGATGYWINGAIPAGFAYPSVIADAVSAVDLDPASSDITASFSSTFPFYFGTDGNTPGGQYDFVSVVLHEIGHGLGFAGFGRVDDNNAPTTGAILNGPYLSQYDPFIENGNPILLTSQTDFTDPSAALLIQFQSNNLYSNAPSTLIYGGNPKIYAPNTWSGGSSYSHWDEATYPAGNEFSLMTPQIGAGEAMHDPGRLTLAFLQDMGLNVCGDVLSITNVVKNSSLIYYPNPAYDKITLKSQSTIDNVAIYDVLGQQISNTFPNERKTLLDLTNLKLGIYFIKITISDNTEIIKIIKK